jgi:ribosomal protein S12 methylthiotransferase accessory factor YcaO
MTRKEIFERYGIALIWSSRDYEQIPHDEEAKVDKLARTIASLHDEDGDTND